MSDIRRLCGTLLHGWFERVEYQIVVGEDIETRVKHVKQEGLLAQLEQLMHEAPQSQDRNSGGSNPNRPGSRPPGSLVGLGLIKELERTLTAFERDAKRLLGYAEPRVAPFAAIHCPHCQGPLVPDADGNVRCTGCAYIYGREEWLGLLP